MRLEKTFFAFIHALLLISFPLQSLATTFGIKEGTQWEYNAGPDPKTAEGRALIDLYASLPEYSVMSDQIMDQQKFRYIFGLMMTRTSFDKNDVKILFIGQDATHIAEAAKQPGTSGFGARVQSVGNYFGVDQGVSTTNAFLSTIKGQYGSFDHLFVEFDKVGEPLLRQSSFVDNQLWMLANGADSEIRKQRELFWEWMIKNNPDSMRLMILFGGASRDAFAEFLIARGAKVSPKMNPDRLANIRVPETKLVYAGGNNEFPVPVTKDGKDVYEILLGRKPDYSKPADQVAAVKAAKENPKRAIELMVFTQGGAEKSGIMNAAQLGGYDLDAVEINGQRTNSMKGLRLSDGTIVKDHIGFTMSAHPSSLSKMTPEAASEALKKSFNRLNELKALGWKVEPDLDDDGKLRRNMWHEGKDYRYGRADIRPGYFEFGAPDDRRVSRADASRLDPQTIVAGSRDRVKFDMNLITSSKETLPSEVLNPEDLWSVRPRTGAARYEFDRGPGPEIAKALISSIDRELLFEPKAGMKAVDAKGQDASFEKFGIDAYNTKTHPDTGLFGFHRGSFSDSRVLILADPHGIDDWITARALTGARGQVLNGLMSDLGVGDKYLVIKTVPVGMDGATAEEWEVTRQRTEKYREVAIREALKSGKIEAIYTDGPIAKQEMTRVLHQLKMAQIPVINIDREGMDVKSGIARAASDSQSRLGWGKGKTITAQMKDIPRVHLTWWSRAWEGTGGDHVIDALGKHRGGTRALITPNWVARQKIRPLPTVTRSIEAIKKTLKTSGLRVGGQALGQFLLEAGIDGKLEKRVMTPKTLRLLPAAAAAGGGRCEAIFKNVGGF